MKSFFETFEMNLVVVFSNSFTFSTVLDLLIKFNFECNFSYSFSIDLISVKFSFSIDVNLF